MCARQIVGIERAAGCKDPGVQFELVRRHVAALRKNVYWSTSRITVYVERNLGFEAEHHEYALRDYDRNLVFYKDAAAKRCGVLTTNEVKHGMCTVTDSMLRERRIVVHAKFVSVGGDPRTALRVLRDQMYIYSYSFKEAASLFTSTRCALTGKIGGSKDDLCICLQLAAYWTGAACVGRR